MLAFKAFGNFQHRVLETTKHNAAHWQNWLTLCNHFLKLEFGICLYCFFKSSIMYKWCKKCNWTHSQRSLQSDAPLSTDSSMSIIDNVYFFSLTISEETIVCLYIKNEYHWMLYRPQLVLFNFHMHATYIHSPEMIDQNLFPGV